MTRMPKRTYDLIERTDFQSLLDHLAGKGYRLIGPRVRDGTVVYDDIASTLDFPIGYIDEQEKGTYRLHQSSEPTLFGCGPGPHAWKKFLYPPTLRLWQAQRHNGNFQIIPETHPPERLALFGVRACELSAIAIQDRVFTGGQYADIAYQAQRENLFVVAVNCGRAGGTCFCASMKTGPRATSGFDLALTEVVQPERHYFVVETGSGAGISVLDAVPHRPASAEEVEPAEQIIERTASQMGRSLDTHHLKELLYASYDSTLWDSAAARCLTCGSCTMVCPTCFCSTVEDVTDLSGSTAERRRVWDSCFTMDFSYIVGGSIRASAKSRYRQWVTHKLGTWIDQFGTSGCVGCGRCITWCPVGLDITEEIHDLQAESTPPRTREKKKS